MGTTTKTFVGNRQDLDYVVDRGRPDQDLCVLLCVILVGFKASMQTTHRLANQSHTQVNDAGVDNLSAPEIIVRFQMLLSRNAVSCDFETAPTLVASTLPLLNSISVGMPRMPYLGGVAGFSSMLSLATFTRPV